MVITRSFIIDSHQAVISVIIKSVLSLLPSRLKYFQSFLFYYCPSGIKPCRGACWCWSILFRKPLSLLSSASASHSDLFHCFLCPITVVVQTCTITFPLKSENLQENTVSKTMDRRNDDPVV